MKRVQILLLMVLVALSIQSCQDELNVPSSAGRSYEQDVAVLNKFVDINKTLHEFYINPGKRSTVLSYITNADAEELAAVNPVNFDLFEQSVGRVSRLSGGLASGCGVDYIVMMANGETYVSRIKDNSPFELVKIGENTRSRYARTASLEVTGYRKEYSVYGNASIETSVGLASQSYKNGGWAFMVSCAMKTNGKREMVKVLFCGVGHNYGLNPRFEWYAGQPDTEWDFEMSSCTDNSNLAIARFDISYQ